MGENGGAKQLYYSFIRSPLTAETSSAFNHLLRRQKVDFDNVALLPPRTNHEPDAIDLHDLCINYNEIPSSSSTSLLVFTSSTTRKMRNQTSKSRIPTSVFELPVSSTFQIAVLGDTRRERGRQAHGLSFFVSNRRRRTALRSLDRGTFYGGRRLDDAHDARVRKPLRSVCSSSRRRSTTPGTRSVGVVIDWSSSWASWRPSPC